MRKRAGGRQRETGHHRQDGGKSHRRDQCQQELAAAGAEEAVAEELGELGCRQVAVRRLARAADSADMRLAYQRGGAKAQERGHDVEAADQAHGPGHRGTGGTSVGNRKEAHQDVRQARGAQDQRHAEGDVLQQGLVDAPHGFLAVLVLDAGLHEVEAGLGVLDGRDLGEEVAQVEAEVQQHEEAEQDGAAHQHHGLDDLHPGGGDHAARDHVDHHQQADQGDRGIELGAEDLPAEPALEIAIQCRDQDLDQRAGADHLRHHVARADRQRGDGGRRAHWHRAHPIGQYIRHRVLAGIAHGFCDQEEHRQVRHQPADGVHEAVVPVEGDEPGDAQERRRRHVIARDGQSVLPAGDTTTGGPKLHRGVGAARGPAGDDERDPDHDQEEQQCDVHDWTLRPASSRTRLARASNTVLARRM